jgi:hypothetical protein
MGQVYEEHKDEDGFLYIAYSGENEHFFFSNIVTRPSCILMRW